MKPATGRSAVMLLAPLALLACHDRIIGGRPPARDGGGPATIPAPWDGAVWPEAGTAMPPPDATADKCAAESFTAQPVPLDLLLLMDRSGSMGTRMPNVKTKWEQAVAALGAFIADPKSAGLGVGMQFFPADLPCASDTDCGLPILSPRDFACLERQACADTVVPGAFPTTCGVGQPLCAGGAACSPLGRCAVSGGFCLGPGTPCPGGRAGDTCISVGKACQFRFGPDDCRIEVYQRPLVPIATLPGALGPLNAALAFTVPNGGTPTGPGVQGAFNHLRMRLAAQPAHHGALVLVTDGLPTSCNSTADTVTAQLGAARAGTPSLTTYVIGVFGPTDGTAAPMTLARWATAGGTGTPFVLSPGDDLSMKLLEALSQVRGAALPCEYMIPTPTTGTLDFKKVNLHYEGAGGEEDVGYVGSADRCDPVRGGWYYDVDPAAGTPTRVVVCPATCAKFKSDGAARVEVRVGCKTVVIE